MTIRKEIIALENVSCNGCFWEIQVSLEELSGFIAMDYDISTKSIDIEYDADQLARAVIEKKIEEAGYFIKGKEYEEIGFWQSLRRAFTRRSN